ncbi:VOC family protein [Sphingobacterium sp. SG20118]|uniref:VOC family protein n=1 Tax=Sphingobacterium TaxID=28453 RepID=UPI0004F5BA9C|nr:MULTISPECIES: VOC family protein [Sphingobacterium]AIM36314.1 glyoxalase [Sphingobacterium sp. ML3W]MDH5827555.1 VOC family protein [Sphingobacterium faecium]
MAILHAYLNFNGNCEEAFEFYQSVFNAPSLGVYRFGDMPADPNFPTPADAANKVMHTAIKINDTVMLMGSDCIEGFGHKATTGTNAYLMLDTQTAEEAKDLYAKLTAGAQNIEMPLGEQFWAELYASFQDKYGISWMVHFEGNKKMQ